MRVPQPWFRKQTGCYYVQFGKKQVNLGCSAKQAKQEYERLLKEHGFCKPEDDLTVRELVELFVEWSREHNEPSTTDWYARFLEPFSEQYGKLRVRQLKPYLVNNWVRRDSWSQATRRCGIVCVKRAVNWGLSQGYLSADPLRSL